MQVDFEGFYEQYNLKSMTVEEINYVIGKNDIDRGEIKDEYHSFRELYDFRKMYNAALFNEWAIQKKFGVHKSFKHFDGEDCFGGGWFIVVANLPSGQISNHYKKEDWNLFQVPAFETALWNFDGHTPADVLERLKQLVTQ